MSIYTDAQEIIHSALEACLPDQAVRRALEGKEFGSGRVFLVALGKAAWQMARCAAELLGPRLERGVVVTKHGHSQGDIPRCQIFEGGHPVPDEGSFRGTRAAMELVQDLTPQDTVVLLVSGGGSALFESPLIPAEELAQLTGALLACGADIVEMNTVRKRLSAVKGGRFAQLCAPAQVYSIVLSDILGDPLDMIASGPAYPDRSTCAQARAIAEKYQLPLSEQARALLDRETPKELDNVETVITGSVRSSAPPPPLSASGWAMRPISSLTSSAARPGRQAPSWPPSPAPTGRRGAPWPFWREAKRWSFSPERAWAAAIRSWPCLPAEGISGMENALIFSLGSDGTDGPTDAAGGIVDGQTQGKLAQAGLTIHQVLADNDAYHALEKVDGLIRTGPTGTNVNDVAVVLLKN